MSKENYRRLGDYIREVDVRNRDFEVKVRGEKRCVSKFGRSENI